MITRKICLVSSIVCLLMSLILFNFGYWINSNSRHVKERVEDKVIVYVVVADRLDEQGSLCELFHSVVWHEWPVMYVLGWTVDTTDKTKRKDDYASVLRKESAQYHTFMLGSKLTLIRKFLDRVVTHGVIVVTDAYDTILQESYSIFFNKYNRLLGAPTAMFSTENDCWPPSFASRYRDTESNVYRHLNSGGYVGEVNALKHILDEAMRDDKPEYYPHHLYFRLDNNNVVAEGEREMIYDGVYDPDVEHEHEQVGSYRVPGVYKRNDQIIFSLLLFSHRFNMTLDHNAQLWQSMQLSRENHQKHIGMRPYYNNDDVVPSSRLANLLTFGNMTFPTFIHFNGPSKNLDDDFTPHNMKRLWKNMWYKNIETTKKKNIYREMKQRIIVMDRFLNRIDFNFDENCS